MEDSCLQRQPAPKVASGISIFLLEELGDARLRCAQLKKYIDEAVQLIEKSGHRDHFFEVGGHLLHGVPDTLLRMDKALSAAAMAAAKLDYEETKDDLRPEKADELEQALEEVRVRRVQRRSKEARESFYPGKAIDAFRTVVLPYLQHETQDAMEQAVTDMMVEFARMRAGNPTSLTTKLERFKPSPDLEGSEWIDQVEEAMEIWFSTMKKTLSVKHAAEKTMKIPEAIAQLEHLAASIESTGTVDTAVLAGLITQLEGPSKKTASATGAIANVLRSLSASLLDTSDPEQRPSRLMLAATLRRVFGDTVDLTAAKKPDNPADRHQLRVLVDTLKNPLKGKFLGGPDAEEAEDTLRKKFKYTDAEIERLKKAADDEEKQSRFEEGKPADPTENMSPEDAQRWKTEHDKNKDKFKSAASSYSGDPRWIHAKYPGKSRDGKSFKKGDLVLYWPSDKSFDVGDKAEAAWRRFESEVADEDVYNRTMTAARIVPLEEAKKGDMVESELGVPWPKDAKKEKFTGKVVRVKTDGVVTVDFTKDRSNPGGHSNEDVGYVDIHPSKKSASADEEKRSRFEEGKPADPTENMSPEDAQRWKTEHDKNKDKFKSASSDPWKVTASGGPSATGSNWKPIEDHLGRRWVWDDGAVSFHVSEFKGPGIPLYRLGVIVELGSGHIGPLQYRRQLKTPEEMFAIASAWFKNIDSFRNGKSMGLDFTSEWNKA